MPPRQGRESVHWQGVEDEVCLPHVWTLHHAGAQLHGWSEANLRRIQVHQGGQAMWRCFLKWLKAERHPLCWTHGSSFGCECQTPEWRNRRSAPVSEAGGDGMTSTLPELDKARAAIAQAKGKDHA